METRQMHKSLLLQPNKFNIRNQRKNKENERMHHRSSLQEDQVNQKFKSLLNKQKTNLNTQQLRQLKGLGRENHSFVNISDKENHMNHANYVKERFGQLRMGNSNILRQNGVPKLNNMNVSMSKHCLIASNEQKNNLTSIHNISELEHSSKAVFNNNPDQNYTNKIDEEESDSTSFKQFKKLTSLHSTRNSTLSNLVSLNKLNLSTMITEDNKEFAKLNNRTRSDPMEFFLDNIGNYYDSIISEKGKNGSIACGGDIFRIQNSLKENMRIILFDWLLDLCQKWKMKLRTFIITITFIDAVLMRCTVTKDIFQLVGLACLFIAGKFEEIYPPSLEEYLESCNNAFSREQLLQIETIILNAIQFNLVILNHLDILELNLKQKLKINNKKIKIYGSDLTDEEQKVITKINNLSEMFLMICMYSHEIHLLNMNNVVDFCIINAIRFVDRQNNDICYKDVSSNYLNIFSLKGKDLSQFIEFIPEFSLEKFLNIEKIMKKMMKTVFDSRQYSIIIKYRQFFVKTLRTYFDMI